MKKENIRKKSKTPFSYNNKLLHDNSNEININNNSSSIKEQINNEMKETKKQFIVQYSKYTKPPNPKLNSTKDFSLNQEVKEVKEVKR